MYYTICKSLSIFFNYYSIQKFNTNHFNQIKF